MSTKIASWDLDGTIGHFHIENREIQGSLRHGIEKVLFEFQKKDIKQVITTAADREYAEIVLDKYNIRKYFQEVFCSNNVGVPIGEKDYTHVIDYFSISRERASEDMIIIGNSNDDHPSILDRMILIQFPEYDNRDAQIIQEIVFSLLPNFETSFQQWFIKSIPQFKEEIKVEKTKIYGTDKETYLIKLL